MSGLRRAVFSSARAVRSKDTDPVIAAREEVSKDTSALFDTVEEASVCPEEFDAEADSELDSEPEAADEVNLEEFALEEFALEDALPLEAAQPTVLSNKAIVKRIHIPFFITGSPFWKNWERNPSHIIMQQIDILVNAKKRTRR